jgi:hypothetical protein
MDAPGPVDFGGGVMHMDGGKRRNGKQGKNSTDHRSPPAVRPQRLNTDVATLFRIARPLQRTFQVAAGAAAADQRRP